MDNTTRVLSKNKTRTCGSQSRILVLTDEDRRGPAGGILLLGIYLQPGSNKNSIFLESEYNHRTLFCRLNIGFASMKKTVDRIPVALIPILITTLAT
jgi:hypothetical protein